MVRLCARQYLNTSWKAVLMAVVDFGAPAIKTDRAHIAANPKVSLSPSGFRFGAPNVTVIGAGAAAVTYFFRGFYPVTGQFQTWSGTSRNTAPPSGNPLVDITITGIL